MTTPGAAPAGYALACRVMSTAQDLLTERPDLAPELDPVIRWLRAPECDDPADYSAQLMDHGDHVAAIARKNHTHPVPVVIAWLDGMNQERYRTVRRSLRRIVEPFPRWWATTFQFCVIWQGARVPVLYHESEGVWWGWGDDGDPLDA